MNERQSRAEKALAGAVKLMLEGDPQKVARTIALRLQTPDGLASAQVLIFADNENIAATLEARLSEPTQAERLGISTSSLTRDWTPTLPSA